MSSRLSNMPLFPRRFALLLVGYAFVGKTVAYIGLAPLYIGEIFLAWGLLRAPILKNLPRLFSLTPFVLLAALVALSMGNAIANVPQYPLVEVLRDSVVWGYSLFALIVAAYCLSTPTIMRDLIVWYGRFTSVYIPAAPAILIFGMLLFGSLPKIPGTEVPLLFQKPGDVAVHLAGVAAFVYLGFRRIGILTLCILAIAVLIVGTFNRGGLLAFISACLVLLTLKPKLNVIVSAAAALVVAVTIFSFIHIEIDLFGRKISLGQLERNIVSIIGIGDVTIGDSKTWRLEWWSEIVDYTIHGDYFWTGKGFGINLANSDGFQVEEDGESLRSPHNSHLTFLARGGVPLFSLWVVLQLSWAIGILQTIIRCRRIGDSFSERFAIFLLAYWTAMIVNMNFDVYLEGPMGGIWFWTIWGLGLAAQWLVRYRPMGLSPRITQAELVSRPV